MQAIADMRISETTDDRQLAALCIAIAKAELQKPDEAKTALEIIAGKRQCLDNLMSHQEVANQALRLIA